ncbi:Uroporphyrinogen decarboxylase [Lysinibacillus sphaericus]
MWTLAILYKDIVTPLPGIGIDVKIKAGVGPVISNPIRSVADVEKLGEFNAKEHTPFVLETIKLLTEHLEVLYDNDYECKVVCDELGANYYRPAMPNTHPLFIDAMVDAIHKKLS